MVFRVSNPRALVEPKDAFDHALMNARRSWAGGTEGVQNWGAAEFSPDGLVIHDLNGEPLFYEFSVEVDRGEVGRIKAAASRLVGAAVVTMEPGPRRWSPNKAMKTALKRAKKDYPDQKVTDRDFVCYCYPKIGVRLGLSGGKAGKEQSVIYDVSDGQQIEVFGEDGVEGISAYSFLDALAAGEQEARLRRFEQEEKELDAARERTPKLFDRDLGKSELLEVKEEFTLVSDYTFIPFYSSKVIKFGPRCSPHDCFMLYAQETDVFCAVATGQMILDFYRYYFDQNDIATAMGTGASGTYNSGQVAGYESLSKNCLDATYDTSANWSEAKAEIDANRPLKSGVPGHARACTGWKRQNFWIYGTSPKKWLQIHDPWPWNSNICQGGAVYWEDWDAVNHTNFIYVRHRSTTCS